ncbi:MAG: hypothetical protein V3U93_04675 [Alphaproteobacteria bacterium]
MAGTLVKIAVSGLVVRPRVVEIPLHVGAGGVGGVSLCASPKTAAMDHFTGRSRPRRRT